MFVNPGLAPGGRWALGGPWYEIGVVFVLPGDVSPYDRQVAAMKGASIEPPTPFQCSGNTPVGFERGSALHQPHEIAQSVLRTKTQQYVDVVGEHGMREHSNAETSARGVDYGADDSGDGVVDATDAPPRVPGDVGVELVRSMLGHAFTNATPAVPGRYRTNAPRTVRVQRCP